MPPTLPSLVRNSSMICWLKLLGSNVVLLVSSFAIVPVSSSGTAGQPSSMPCTDSLHSLGPGQGLAGAAGNREVAVPVSEPVRRGELWDLGAPRSRRAFVWTQASPLSFDRAIKHEIRRFPSYVVL